MNDASASARGSHHERTILVLQGGGALGAYQAGAYQALAEAGYMPDWIAGISIGAVNAALIAGNPPARRIERLREFWELVSTSYGLDYGADLFEPLRGAFARASSAATMLFGRPGFFHPRVPPPWLAAPGTEQATSYYDTGILRETLQRLVDFERINAGSVRLSLGAVNVRTGNFVYFDNTRQRLSVDHVMASGALPPGFPAIEIDGEQYWDAGIVSNTPLNYVLEDQPRRNSLLFQIDLFSARGEPPRNIEDVMERQKDITYSSRTRHFTDNFRERHEIRRAVTYLLARLPEDLRADPSVRRLESIACGTAMDIVHLIYRRKMFETHSKDYEFSRVAMGEHWRAGIADARLTLARPEWLAAPPPETAVRVFDFVPAAKP